MLNSYEEDLFKILFCKSNGTMYFQTTPTMTVVHKSRNLKFK